MGTKSSWVKQTERRNAVQAAGARADFFALKCTCSWTRVEKLSSCYKSALEGIKLLLLLLILLRFLNWGKTLFLPCKGMHGHNFCRTLCQQSELTTRCHLHFTLVLNADLRAVDAILGYHVLHWFDPLCRQVARWPAEDSIQLSTPQMWITCGRALGKLRLPIGSKFALSLITQRDWVLEIAFCPITTPAFGLNPP